MNFMYLVYCKNNRGSVQLLGPLLATQQEAEAEVERLREQGWDASWVGMSQESQYIVT